MKNSSFWSLILLFYLQEAGGERLILISCIWIQVAFLRCLLQASDEVSNSCGGLAVPVMMSVLVSISLDLKEDKLANNIGLAGHLVAQCWPLSTVYFLHLVSWLGQEDCVHACQHVMTDRVPEENLDCATVFKGVWWSPEARRSQPSSFGSCFLLSEQAPGFSAGGGAGLPLWFGRIAGWGKLFPSCSRLGFRQETKVRHVVKITHVFLAEFKSRFMKIDFVISAVLGNDHFLVEDAWRVSRIYSYCGWKFWILTPRRRSFLPFEICQLSCLGIKESVNQSGSWRKTRFTSNSSNEES